MTASRDELRPDQPQRLPPRRRGHRRLRGGAGRSPASSTPPADEIVFTKNATEALNLVAQAWGRANLGRRRRRAHPHGAPRQHRAVAHARRRAGHRAALGPAHPRRPARPHRTSTPARRRQGLSFTAMSNVLGTLTPVTRAVQGRPRRRRARRRRRLPVRAPQRHRRAGVGRRLRRLLEPQDVRPVRHRRAVGPGRAARRHARRSSAAAT